MLCPLCNAYRPANSAPCQYCQAPSPLAGASMNSYGAMTSPPSPGIQWDNSSPASPLTTNGNDNSLWAQVMAPQMTQPPVQAGNSEAYAGNMLPVPYQPGNEMIASQQPMRGAAMPAPYDPGSQVPAIPGEANPIHIPPMYTKPRPIIPRYRAISGLLSVVIVFVLLCSGASYYAKASGKLTFLHQIYGDVPLKNIHPSPTTLPIPPNMQADYGPAAIVINSATTASKIDYQTAFALVQTNTFQPGQSIFLTYSVHPKSPGSVTVKWYTNNMLYQTSQPVSIKEPKNGYTVMQYPQPVEGKVEIYWNNALAIRIYFVVQ